MYTKVILAHVGQGKSTRLAQLVTSDLIKGKKVLFLSTEINSPEVYLLVNSQMAVPLLSVRGNLSAGLINNFEKEQLYLRGMKFDVVAYDNPRYESDAVVAANIVGAETLYYTKQLNRFVDEVEFVQWDRENYTLKVK